MQNHRLCKTRLNLGSKVGLKFGAHCFEAQLVMEQNCFGLQSFEVRSLTSIWVGSTRLYSGLPPNLLWCWLLYIGKLVKLVLWIQCALYLPSCIVINNLMQIMPCAQSNFRNILANINPNILLKFLCETILLKIVGYRTFITHLLKSEIVQHFPIITISAHLIKILFLLTADILDIRGCI